MTKKLYILTTVILVVCTLPWAYRLYKLRMDISVLETAFLRETIRNEKRFDDIIEHLATELEAWHPRSDRYAQLFALADSLQSMHYVSDQPVSFQIDRLLDRFEPYLVRAHSSFTKTFLKEFLKHKRVDLWDEALQYRYYKYLVIVRLFEDLAFSSTCTLCLARLEVIRVRMPHDGTYQIYLGSNGHCENPYNLKVNGVLLDQDYKWCYTPTHTGIDTILVEIQDFDYGLQEYVIDTIYYPIRVVDPNDQPVRS